MAIITMTKAEKTEALAAARFEEAKAHHRMLAAQTVAQLADQLVSATFRAIPAVLTAPDAAIEAAKGRHEEARRAAADAREAVRRVVNEYHEAAERRRDVDDARVA